jgi:hypothetical protein
MTMSKENPAKEYLDALAEPTQQSFLSFKSFLNQRHALLRDPTLAIREADESVAGHWLTSVRFALRGFTFVSVAAGALTFLFSLLFTAPPNMTSDSLPTRLGLLGLTPLSTVFVAFFFSKFMDIGDRAYDAFLYLFTACYFWPYSIFTVGSILLLLANHYGIIPNVFTGVSTTELAVAIAIWTPIYIWTASKLREALDASTAKILLCWIGAGAIGLPIGGALSATAAIVFTEISTVLHPLTQGLLKSAGH